MTIKAKIADALKRMNAVCDDCLAEMTSVSPRQTINRFCREMASENMISRATETCSRCSRPKTVNRLGSEPASAPVRKPVPLAAPSGERPWYWEGHVQQKIVQFLIDRGCTINSTADTASRQHGKDIVARTADGRTLWVTVKGFPEKSKNPQARHWFDGALGDLTRYRDEDSNVLLAMGLPRGLSTYEGLLKRTQTVRKSLAYAVYWVSADGAVTVEQ